MVNADIVYYRKVLESDLEQAETKLDNMLQTLTREKDQRYSNTCNIIHCSVCVCVDL